MMCLTHYKIEATNELMLSSKALNVSQTPEVLSCIKHNNLSHGRGQKPLNLPAMKPPQ